MISPVPLLPTHRRRRIPLMARLPVLLALAVLAVVVAMAILAPWVATDDPGAISTIARLKGPGPDHLLGTDAFGRDIFSRLVHGARISLIVGLGATAISVLIGLVIGVLAGYFRLLDAIIMRIMDGIMAVPGILLAIALVSLSGATLTTVMVAITVPEIPRVVRLVRGVILDIRSESFVEAAVTLGSPIRRILIRHMVPSTVAPLTVQATFIFAASILTEATLSFLGAGLPTEIPSWGNIMAQGRMYFQLLPGMVLFPGLTLAATLLSVNLLGDALRDRLDPKTAKR